MAYKNTTRYPTHIYLFLIKGFLILIQSNKAVVAVAEEHPAQISIDERILLEAPDETIPWIFTTSAAVMKDPTLQ
jgi:hypothetical protein